jgi:hypothetical protein
MTEVDYLVIGAGTAGMAFTDALISHSGCSVLMVDRRHAPGGHWNDAYPFVQLHQPSAYYGVDSLNLGQDRIDDTGLNAGLYERASGLEVRSYFRTVLESRFLPSGQVEFRPMSECREDGGTVTVTSLLTGVSTEVTVRKKIVDARYLEGSIPATHRPRFDVDDDVRCIPINDLVHVDTPADGYVILGGGKTGMDACLWLLDNGVAPEAISWIRPRDAWITPRETVQARGKVSSTFISYAESLEISVAASSVPDLFDGLESAGHLARLDPAIEPGMFHAATASQSEMEVLRRIERVIRRGRVRRITGNRIVLDQGDVTIPGRPLYIDCTASALSTPPVRPIFETNRVTIQSVRSASPSFNAALIGYLEATRDHPGEQNRIAPPSSYPLTATDWVRSRHDSMVANMRWNEAADVARWVNGTRLNLTAGIEAHAGEPEVAAAFATFNTQFLPALENLAKFCADLGSSRHEQ